jgi:hypothetical protein
MAYAAPSIDDLFGGLPAEKRVERFEAYKAALSSVHNKSITAAREGRLTFDTAKGAVITENPVDRFRADITKAMSGDQLAAVESALSNIEKDLTLTSPLNNSTSGVTGLVPYNLDPVLSLLVPKELYFRNSTPRIKAIGQALEFRRITGVSNSGTGGVAATTGFFQSSSASTSFGGVSLNRPGKITYAADKFVLPFHEFGFSDSVSLQAEYAGMGYTDLRQLSHTALIWAHFLGEERAILNSSASALSVSGLTFTAANDATAPATGAASGTATVYVTLSNSYGETARISAGTVTLVANQGVKVTYTGTVSSNAVALNIYITDSASANFKATSALTTSGQTGLTFASSSAAPTTDGSYPVTSGTALGYDGIINTIINNSGYVVNNYGSVASATEVAGFAQDAFISLFNSVMGDPEAIVTSAAVRRAVAKSAQSQSNASSYRLTYELGGDGIALGSLVSGVQNEATGRMVDLVTHRFMPAGVAVVLQKQLPFPDSGVSNCWEIHNVVDSMVIDWPQIGFTYDVSSYSLTTLAGRAPAWSGVITGLTA